ncbi:MAG: hypothetical protein R6U61_04895 [Thermoplasmata archaeon]
MGCRAHIVNLETGKKVYSHWGALAFDRAISFEELQERVEELYEKEIDHRPPEKVEIEEFTDDDAVDDLDLHIERVFVLGKEDVSGTCSRHRRNSEGIPVEFRGYTRTILHDTDDGITDDMVVFKFSDSATYWKARHISLRLDHYNDAYMKLNIEEHKNEALEQALRNRLAQLEDDVEVIYSTVVPRKYDFAVKQIVKDWPSKDENGPDIVLVSHLLEQQGVL